MKASTNTSAASFLDIDGKFASMDALALQIEMAVNLVAGSDELKSIDLPVEHREALLMHLSVLQQSALYFRGCATYYDKRKMDVLDRVMPQLRPSIEEAMMNGLGFAECLEVPRGKPN